MAAEAPTAAALRPARLKDRGVPADTSAVGTAQELERVRRELREATLPAKLASFAGGRAVLFDDRVEMDRFVIGLAPGGTLTDVVVTGSGRSGVVYLSVSGPDGSRSLRLKSDEETGAREFAAAVRDAAERVPGVQAERDRRIQELGARVVELTAEPRPPAVPPLLGDVVPGPREPESLDPLVDDVPDPADWPSPAARAAARTAGVVGSGTDAVHVVTDVPDPFDDAPLAATAAPEPESRRGRRERRHRPRARRAPKPPPEATEEPGRPTTPKPPKQRRPLGKARWKRRAKGARSSEPPTAPRAPLDLRKPLAALLGVLLVAGGTATGVQLLRGRDLPLLSGTESSAPEKRSPEDPASEQPKDDEPQEPVAGDPAGGRSALTRAAAALRKRLGRGDVDVLDVDVRGGTLTVDVRQTDPSGMARQTGEVFAGIHASGLDPGTAVLQHYAMVRDPVTGRTELGVVGVYRMSREESETVDWAKWGDISWDNFLTYRDEDWP